MTAMTWWRYLAALVAGLTLLAAPVEAQEKKEEPKKEKPKPSKTDEPDGSKLASANWKKRHEAFLERAKQGGVDVLFLGDSITQGWESNGKEAWKQTFEPLKAANFGISGDRTQDVLWRITEGKELEGIDPKVAVLMIGTNNTGGNSADEIAAGITKIVTTLRDKKPQMKVLLLGVFPRSGKPGKSLKDADKVAADELQPKIKEINQRIAKLDDGKNVVYLDIGGKFLDDQGSLAKEIMPDFLHLSVKGYQIWSEAVKAKVEELLK